MSSETPPVQHNQEQHRYEIEIEGQRAKLEYMDAGGVRYYTHTEVPKALEGRGIAGKLAKAALDEAQAQGLTIVPQCPFVRGYIEKHSEYTPLVKY